jgi:sulfur carrier protein
MPATPSTNLAYSNNCWLPPIGSASKAAKPAGRRTATSQAAGRPLYRNLLYRVIDMNIIINGESQQLDSVSTVAELIAQLGYQGKRIAIERNGDIVPKSQHGDTPLTDGDQLEIVVAVGGG